MFTNQTACYNHFALRSLNKEKAFVGPLTGHCEISIRVHHPDHGGHNNGPQVIRLMVTLRGDIAAM